MISKVEVLNYRCLRYVSNDLAPFQVLVGPNASGKSTFLDVIDLVADLLRDGVQAAVSRRSRNLRDLMWMGKGERFQIALEMVIPDDRRRLLKQPDGWRRVRYELAIGFSDARELSVLGENLWLRPENDPARPRQLDLPFPSPLEKLPSSLLTVGRAPQGWRSVITKALESGDHHFKAETHRWIHPFRLGPLKLALANLPEDEEGFPIAVWVKHTLMEGVQRLILNSEAMRRPAPPLSPRGFQPDGSNLPLVVKTLQQEAPQRFKEWVAHVRTALPELRSIDTVEREEDRHRYLRLEYASGFRAPSWVVSDGTLRLLALTLIAYLEGKHCIYLIEEPENGIHPKAMETVFQSLSSAYDEQVLCATHSPVILSRAEPQQLLCFAKNDEGATDIRSGSEHPILRNWQREADLGTLFAAGVLG